MGVISLDVELQAFLTDGFDYVRAHLDDSVDEIFSNFKQPHLAKLYGDKEIKTIKKWLREQAIPVVQSWGLQPTLVPCISIHLAQSSEQTGHSFLGDLGGTVTSTATPLIIIPPFTCASYDSATGKVTTKPGTDISALRNGYILVDGAGELWLVDGTIGNDYFHINTDAGGLVDTSKFYIQSAEGTVRAKGGQALFQDMVDIGIHGHTNQNTVLWMYYIISWLLFRFKSTLEARGIQLQTFSGTEFNKDMKFLGEHIYSRWMRFVAQTEVEWTETPYVNVDTVDLTDFKADESGDTDHTTDLGDLES